MLRHLSSNRFPKESFGQTENEDVAEDNDVYREYVHFYGVERINVTKDGQIGKGELYKYFYFYYQTLLDFYNLSRFAQRHQSCIYNTCMGSYIDVFPKKNVEYFLNN